MIDRLTVEGFFGTDQSAQTKIKPGIIPVQSYSAAEKSLVFLGNGLYPVIQKNLAPGGKSLCIGWQTADPERPFQLADNPPTVVQHLKFGVMGTAFNGFRVEQYQIPFDCDQL